MFELSNGSPIPDSCDDTPPAGCQDLHECDKPRNERYTSQVDCGRNWIGGCGTGCAGADVSEAL